MKAFLFSIVVVCLVLSPIGSSLHAGWIEDGFGVGDELLNQRHPYMIPDSEGGCYIAWTDWRSGAGYVYVQHLDRNGDDLWAAGGVRACLYNSSQSGPVMVADGSGNIIVAWTDLRPSYRLYAQKMDPGGARLWTPTGEPVSANGLVMGSKAICSDDAGGAILVWEDDRNGNRDIYAQRILSDGNEGWDIDDEPIDTGAHSDIDPAVIPDGAGGAIVTWRNGTGLKIKAQRLAPTGSLLWMAGGEDVCGHLFWAGEPVITSDNAGGAIIAWDDLRGVDSDIYVQRVKHDGSMLWTADGELICAATGEQLIGDIASDGEWGAVIVWEDLRNPSNLYDVYAQRVDGWGTDQWTSNGIAMYAGNGNQYEARIDTDGNGGYYLAWLDERSGVDTDIFSKRINQSGFSLWSSLMGTVCTALYGQSAHTMVHDGEGNILIAWEDERSGSEYDIYAQRIECNGYWGDPAPSIASVRDIPGDQGGLVNISFDASRLDIWPENEISSYTIWRAIDEQAAMAMMKSGVPMFSSPGEIGTDAPGALRTQELAGEIYYWSQVGQVIAQDYFDEYSDLVTTLFDSTAVSTEYNYFQVIAHGGGPDAFWISAPDSGYSVDNLAPCPPLALAGEQSFVPEGLELTWTPNAEPDLDSYRIYRGTDPGFDPGDDNLLVQQCDTMLLDEGWDWSTEYWYKIEAVDIHGNRSELAVFGPDMVTGDDPMPVPDATFLSQNYPNPFNPNTTIAFGLESSGFVNLSIYNAAGQLVAELINESRPAGQYAAVWNGNAQNGSSAASGVYFYMLKAGPFEETRKMILIR